MAKNCINHANAPAITMCTQCHKPICQSCTMVTPKGRFCSSECSILHKEITTKLGDVRGGKKGGGALKVIFVILVIVAAAFLVHFAAHGKPADHILKKVDVIGRFIDKTP